jgi:hypothetical protein
VGRLRSLLKIQEEDQGRSVKLELKCNVVDVAEIIKRERKREEREREREREREIGG